MSLRRDRIISKARDRLIASSAAAPTVTTCRTLPSVPRPVMPCSHTGGTASMGALDKVADEGEGEAERGAEAERGITGGLTVAAAEVGLRASPGGGDPRHEGIAPCDVHSHVHMHQHAHLHGSARRDQEAASEKLAEVVTLKKRLTDARHTLASALQHSLSPELAPSPLPDGGDGGSSSREHVEIKCLLSSLRHADRE